MTQMQLADMLSTHPHYQLFRRPRLRGALSTETSLFDSVLSTLGDGMAVTNRSKMSHLKQLDSLLGAQDILSPKQSSQILQCIPKD